MKNKKVLFGICGSFCNHARVLVELEKICKHNEVQVVVSENVYTCSTRFFDNKEFIKRLQEVSGNEIIHTIAEAEKVGPENAFDIMVIAPMTATVVNRLANGLYDHPVTLAAKAMIRNRRNVVFGIATNDGLGISGPSILRLMNMKYLYVIPFRQDAPFEKERSIVSDWSLIEKSCNCALKNEQIQPILLGGIL